MDRISISKESKTAIKKVFSILTISLLVCVFWVAPAGAVIVVEDDFEDGVLDPAWDIYFDYATGWTAAESGTDFTVTDIIPATSNDNQGERVFSSVYISRKFSPLADFHVDFDFSWDSEGSVTAMQGIKIDLIASGGGPLVALAGYYDPWTTSTGQPLAYVKEPNDGSWIRPTPLPLSLNGRASVDIIRVGSHVDILWNGNILKSGTNAAEIDHLMVQFIRYLSQGGSDTSPFGNVSIDLVRVEGVPANPSVPSPPTITDLIAGDKEITINWNAVPEATSYNLYWSTTPGVDRLTAHKISNATSPYVHTGLTNGITYYYRVTAENSSGESADSPEAYGTPQSISPDATAINLISPQNNQTVTFEAENGQVNFNFTSVPDATAYRLDINLKGIFNETGVDLTWPLISPSPDGAGGTPGFSINGFGAAYGIPLDRATWDALALYDFSWSVSALADPSDMTSIMASSERWNFKLQPSGSILLMSPSHRSVLTKSVDQAPSFTWNVYPGAVSYRLILAHAGLMGFDELLDYPGQVLNLFPVDSSAWQNLQAGAWYWTVIGLDAAGNWITPNYTIFSFTVQ